MADILNLLDQPDDDRGPSLAELSDAELRAAVTAVCERRDELAEPDPELAGQLNHVLVGLVMEWDRRAELAVAVDDAMTESLGIRSFGARRLDASSTRRRRRGRSDGG